MSCGSRTAGGSSCLVSVDVRLIAALEQAGPSASTSEKVNSIIVLHVPHPGHSTRVHEPALLARLPYAKRLELEGRSDDDRAASLAGIALAWASLRSATGMAHTVGEFVFAQG